jgi:hypothetical protein
MDKQVIACVEGRISKVQEKIASGTGQYGDWAMQFGAITDASNVHHNWTITDESLFLTQQDVGSTIRYESMPQSKGGPAGVTMSIRNDKQGNPQRSIKIDNRACVTRVDGKPASSGGQSAPTQQRAVSAQSGPPPEKLPVRNRIHLYLNILAETWAQIGNRQDLPAITVSDVKDIATHISMTYDNRENYQQPMFKKPEAPKPAPKPEPEDDLDYGATTPEGEDLPFGPAFKSLGTAIF